MLSVSGGVGRRADEFWNFGVREFLTPLTYFRINKLAWGISHIAVCV
jgi:hypothetical protein